MNEDTAGGQKTPLLPTEEEQVLDAVRAVWDYINFDSEPYGRTTVTDEIGACLDRIKMHRNRCSPAAAAWLETCRTADIQTLLKARRLSWRRFSGG